MLALTADKLGVQRCKEWQIDYIYSMIDADGSGDISFEEFDKHYFQISEELRKCPQLKGNSRVVRASNQMNTKKGIMVMNDEEREGFYNSFKDLICQIKNLEIKKLNQKKAEEKNNEDQRSDHGTGLDKLNDTFKQDKRNVLLSVSNQLNNNLGVKPIETDVNKLATKNSKLEVGNISNTNEKEKKKYLNNQIEKNVFDISIAPKYKNHKNDSVSVDCSRSNELENDTSLVLETNNNNNISSNKSENLDKNLSVKAGAQKIINSILLEGKSLRRFQKKKFDNFRPVENFLKTEYQCNEGRSGFFKDYSLQELEKMEKNVETLKIWLTSTQNLITHYQTEEQKFVQKHFSNTDTFDRSKSHKKLYTVNNIKSFQISKQDLSNIKPNLTKQNSNPNLTWNLSSKEPFCPLQNLDTPGRKTSKLVLNTNKSDYFINQVTGNKYSIPCTSLNKNHSEYKQRQFTKNKFNTRTYENLDFQMGKKQISVLNRTSSSMIKISDRVFFYLKT